MPASSTFNVLLRTGKPWSEGRKNPGGAPGVALQRAGKPAEAAQALSSIKPSTRSTEPHLAFYLSLLHFYQGRVTEAKVLPPNPSPGDVEAELAYNTICYGVGNWHLYHGDTAASLPYFRKVVAGDAWNSWVFIGAETDLARQ